MSWSFSSLTTVVMMVRVSSTCSMVLSRSSASISRASLMRVPRLVGFSESACVYFILPAGISGKKCDVKSCRSEPAREGFRASGGSLAGQAPTWFIACEASSYRYVRSIPAQRTADLVFGDARFEEVLLLAQVHDLAHPRERVADTLE